MAQYKDEISGEVRITGVINDTEFSASGEASGNPSTGEYKVHLDYENVPDGWHPLMYTDVKVSLLFLREENGAKNFLSLADGTYRSAGTIDFGDGYNLRNHTSISMIDQSTFRAVYVMTGTARMDELTDMEYFEETMIPMGQGRVAALALARWTCRREEPLDAMFATMYTFKNGNTLDQPQVRRIEASPNFEINQEESQERKRFSSNYTGMVTQIPRPRSVEEGGPYVGFLIS